MSIAANVGKIQNNIKKFSNNNGLITVLAASKAQSREAISEAIQAGIVDFGENRVQEAEEKWPELKLAFPHIRLHLIGPLQTNKVKQALALFDTIQTIDRLRLADEIAHNPLPADRRFFIQVNIGKEPQKAGVMPDETQTLIAHCKSLALPIAGLMCIPPHNQPPAPHFAMLKHMALQNGLAELSMGMSDDYETAIRMGATCVRLGRVLFGERN